jgi:hypothetical protein
MKKIPAILLIALIMMLTGIVLPTEKHDNYVTEKFLKNDDPVDEDCKWNGISLRGKIKFVESFPDIKIKVVESFPDLKVKLVSSFPEDCGEWQIVESFPDIKVQVVESFPDITVKFVESFPGLP